MIRNHRKVPWEYRGFVRKTSRRQTKPADDIEVTLTFVLPMALWGFVIAGPTGHHGVTIRGMGSVQVKARGVTLALEAAGRFLASICPQRTFAHPIAAVLSRSDKPTWQRMHDITVTDGVVEVPRHPKPMRFAAA